MKLLFYINTIHKGGAERVMSNLANRFAADGIDVTLVTSFPTEDDYPLDEKVKRITIASEYETSFFKRNILWINKLRKIIIDVKPDAVISFMAEPNYRSLIATIGLKTKKIISIRNDPNKEYPSRFHKSLAKLLFRRADGVVFQTEDAKKWFPKQIQKKSCIIMNQVKEELFHVVREEENYYVALGRVVPQKNYAMMICGFAGLLKAAPDEQLLIYGEGDTEPYIELIKNLGVEENIHFMGTTNDVASVLKKAKAFLMTSDYEGMPNALLEAMAVGLPCICTDCPCGGPKMVITHGENGVLVPVGNEEELIRSLLEIHHNETYRTKLGENAKVSSFANEPQKINHDWKKYIHSIINVGR